MINVKLSSTHISFKELTKGRERGQENSRRQLCSQDSPGRRTWYSSTSDSTQVVECSLGKRKVLGSNPSLGQPKPKFVIYCLSEVNFSINNNISALFLVNTSLARGNLQINLFDNLVQKLSLDSSDGQSNSPENKASEDYIFWSRLHFSN
ncbi:hypothetical protein M0804_008821 [Polistes exclamans]|nr:hypothetical protein M0804_008821 [Polistes exclamans]